MPTPHIGAEAIVPVVQATGRIQGNHAIPVYVYTSIPSDRRGLGASAQPVVFINDSDLVENGGQYKLEGRLTALPIIELPAGSRAIGMPAIPVYDVTNKDWPPAFNPVIPNGNVPTINAIAYYKMDEVSGVRHDSVNGFDLIEVDNGNFNLPPPATPVASAAGKIGLCAVLLDDPAGPSVLFLSGLSVNVSAGFYVGCWIKKNVWNPTFYGLQVFTGTTIGLDPNGGLLTAPALISKNDGTFHFSILASMPPSTIPLADLDWHFCLFWYDPSVNTQHLLVDNATEITFTPAPSTPFSTLTSIQIDAPNFNDNTDGVFVDEVLIASGLPTQAVKDYLWNSGNGRTHPFT